MKKTAALNALVYCDADEALALIARFASRKRGILPAAAKRAMKRWEQLAQSNTNAAGQAGQQRTKEVSHV